MTAQLVFEKMFPSNVFEEEDFVAKLAKKLEVFIRKEYATLFSRKNGNPRKNENQDHTFSSPKP